MSMKEIRELEAPLPRIIAVDFDGTLVEDAYPSIGAIRPNIWNAVKDYQSVDWKIILWTCRTGQQLIDAVDFCAKHSLHFDAINENIAEIKAKYGGDTRKVFADIYLDDRMKQYNSELEAFMSVPLEV